MSNIDDELPTSQGPDQPIDPVQVTGEGQQDPAAPASDAPVADKPATELPVDEPEVQVIQQRAKVDAEWTKEGNLKNAPTLHLPADFEEQMLRAIDKGPNVSVEGSEQGRSWAASLMEGTKYTMRADMLRATLEQEGSTFTNRLRYGDAALFSGFPGMNVKGNSDVKGEAAVLRIMSTIGTGRNHSTALYNSGFYVTFKPASDSAKIELNRILLSDEIRLGRRSYGLLASSVTGITVERLVNVAMQHIYETSVDRADMPFEKVAEHVVCQDLPSFLWGFIAACYPDGFNYERACSASPGECDRIEKAILNLSKLQFACSTAFKPEQLGHMSRRRPYSMKLAQVKAYREGLAALAINNFSVPTSGGEKLVFHVRNPSLTEYIDNSHAWVDSIAAQVVNTLGQEASEAVRNASINMHAKASSICQYGHWIEKIEIVSEDGENRETIADKDSVSNVLATLSSNDDIRNAFFEKVIDYINKSTTAVIGIPAYTCPKCKKDNEHKGAQEEFKNVIPLDVIQTFFELLSQTQAAINTR